MGEAVQSRRWIGGEWWDLKGGMCTSSHWGVIPRCGSNKPFLSEEAVQRITESSEDRRVQGPVTKLSLTHALQQVWVT